MSDQTSDLLEQAKAGEGGDVVAVDPRASRRDGPAKGRGTAIKLAVVFVLLAVGVAALLGSGTDSPFVYSRMVDEVASHPAEHMGRTLRVEGQLTSGSVQFREDPCEWRFTLEQNGEHMPVEFPQCVVPDTFRDGMGISVVVEGTLREDGSFAATQVIPRCPSRYEMEQRQQAGETMPHAAPPSS